MWDFSHLLTGIERSEQAEAPRGEFLWMMAQKKLGLRIEKLRQSQA